ncbi:hypothetical protein BC835DRAFT_1369022 [Cytidiella melzeri]|nr:hypothetical protein BC835DRAFT_1369022 [Cytidiella melzeri]
MSVCVTTPTATQFGTVTTNSLSTTASASETTLPASVTTIESTVCTTLSAGVTGDCVTSEIVSTISPAQVITTQIPVVVTVPVTLTTPIATLFGTTCSGGSISSISSSVTPPPVSSSSIPQSSTSTLPPTTSDTVIQSSSTLPGGSVVVVSSTSTTVITPTTVVPVSGKGGSPTNLGAIIGGVVGGVALIAAILLLVLFCLRKRHKNRDDDFDHTDGKINPFPIRLHKNSGKGGSGGMTIDDPNPFDPYAGATPAAAASQDGTAVSGAAASLPATSSVRRRTGTMSDSFPNPYNAVPSSTDEYHRAGSPPAPASDSSVVSESVYSQQSRRPLHVANPSGYPPIGDIQHSRQPPRMPLPLMEESEPSVYAPTSVGEPTSPHAGTSSAPFVHQDAGPGPRRTKAAEARSDAVHEQVEAPPAYEA